MWAYLWERILAWLAKYVWPEVQAALIAMVHALIRWIFERIREFIGGRSKRRQEEARQRAEEADKAAEEAEGGVRESDERAKQAEVELERLRAELDKCRFEGELEKQKAIAEVWRDVVEMLSREHQTEREGLEQIEHEAQSRAEETISALKAEDFFPEYTTPLPAPPDVED